MTILQAIILGIVQGITEFLPISSSAHLVLVPYIFDWQLPADQIFSFDVLIQLGTLVAVIVYFRKDLYELIVGFFSALLKRDWGSGSFRLGILLILASVPAGIIGLALKDLVEKVFHHAGITGLFLIVTAGILLLAERLGKRERTAGEQKWGDALIIGLFQALSIFPGISRSGATIAGGMLRNLRREEAARFSFLMSIPVLFMAGLVSALDLGGSADLSGFLPVLLVGFFVSALVGYASIHWLLSFLKTRPLYVFSIYCAVIGLITIVLFYG